MSDFEGMAEIAEYNLRRFVGDKADRDVATKAFPFWEGYEFITMATRNKVLASFPVPAEREPMPGVDCVLPDDLTVEEQVERAVEMFGAVT